MRTIAQTIYCILISLLRGRLWILPLFCESRRTYIHVVPSLLFCFLLGDFGLQFTENGFGVFRLPVRTRRHKAAVLDAAAFVHLPICGEWRNDDDLCELFERSATTTESRRPVAIYYCTLYCTFHLAFSGAVEDGAAVNGAQVSDG